MPPSGQEVMFTVSAPSPPGERCPPATGEAPEPIHAQRRGHELGLPEALSVLASAVVNVYRGRAAVSLGHCRWVLCRAQKGGRSRRGVQCELSEPDAREKAVGQQPCHTCEAHPSLPSVSCWLWEHEPLCWHSQSQARSGQLPLNTRGPGIGTQFKALLASLVLDQ